MTEENGSVEYGRKCKILNPLDKKRGLKEAIFVGFNKSELRIEAIFIEMDGFNNVRGYSANQENFVFNCNGQARIFYNTVMERFLSDKEAEYARRIISKYQ